MKGYQEYLKRKPKAVAANQGWFFQRVFSGRGHMLCNALTTLLDFAQNS
jgi:hypothetical protein